MRTAAILALLGASALSSCSRSTATPSGTVAAYFEAGKRGGQAAAFEYVQEKDRKWIEEMKALSGAAKTSEPERDFSYRILNEKISGDTATVTVALKYGGQEHNQELRLIREGGGWKIDLFSEEQLDAMKGLKRLTEEAKKKAAGVKGAPSDEDMKKIEALMKSLEDEGGEAESEE